MGITKFSGFGQVLLVANASLLTIFIAVTLSAVRLLPMTISLIPLMYANKEKTQRWKLIDGISLCCSDCLGFCNVFNYHICHGQQEFRIFSDFAITLKTCVLVVCGIAFFVAGYLPPLAVAGSILAYPDIFYVVTLECRDGKFLIRSHSVLGSDYWTGGLFIFSQSLILVISGLVGGTLAYLGYKIH